MVPGKGVVLKRDGTPLSGARVEFFPAAVADRSKLKGMPYSLTDKNGEFELVIFSETGLPPGKYKVIVWEIPPNKDSAVVPAIYQDPDTSPWELEIPKTGKTDIRLQIGGN